MKRTWLGAAMAGGALLVAACGGGGGDSASGTTKPPDKAAGQKVYSGKGCNACHSTDGSKMTGPSFKGIWGSEVTLEGGTKAKVDGSYIAKSIKEPNSAVVEGYSPVMPALTLSNQEIADISAYIESLK